MCPRGVNFNQEPKREIKKMKKLIYFLLLGLFLASSSYPQVKVKFKLMDPGVDSEGLFYFNLVAVVQAGQTWRVGSSNIRVAFRTVPTGGLTVHPDAGTVQNPLACINSGGYSPLTTTPLNGGVRISFNITRTGACCVLTPGTYVLGRLRFNRIDTTSCTIDTISTSGGGASVVQDSITPLTYPTQWLDSNYSTCILITKVEKHASIPKVFSLYQNYPNPFNPATTIKFDLPKAAYTKLTIYDVLGREVLILVDKKMDAGSYSVIWNASSYASGTYIYKIEAGDYTNVKKMIFVK
jgi:Secretion system C-terminal sorting domain